jgi:DDE_Tnp_1-associated
MDGHAVEFLWDMFDDVPDPRDPRGVRHPIRGILGLTFLGLLARIRELEVLCRWAKVHWAELRGPLGFDRDEPPVATTISRVLARCSFEEFSRGFARWLRRILPGDQRLSAAVDGKTSRQSRDAEGNPVQLVTVLVHQLKFVLAQWSTRGEKTNEAGVLKNHLAELLETFPMLGLISGDAIYAQRPLAELFQGTQCDYLFQVKQNQPNLLDALTQCLGMAHEKSPAAETVEKKGFCKIAADCGSIWTMPSTSAKHSAFLTSALGSASIAI